MTFDSVFDTSLIVLNNIRGLGLIATLTEEKETKACSDLVLLLRHYDEVTRAGNVLYIKDQKRKMLLEVLLEENSNLKAENEKLKKSMEWNKPS